MRTIAALSVISAASAARQIPTSDIPATSKLGSRILSASRPAGEGRQLDQENFAWVTNYSIKFQKCATSDEYYGGMFGGEEQNNDGNQYWMNGGGIYKQRLVHYKLCPTNSCGDSCSGGADYVIDMGLFVEAYIESKMDAQEYNCEQARENCYYDDEDQ